MADNFINTSTGDEEEEEAPKQEVKLQKVKRRGSVFSKLGSYRQKKQQQQTRDSGKVNQGSHQFVLVSCSNSITCDVCGKSIANKPAVQCQNCLLNVHENLCKDQTFPCVRCQHAGMSNGDSLKDKSCSLPEGGGGSGSGQTVHLKSSASVKEKRALSVPIRTSTLVGGSISTAPRSSSPGKAITEDNHKNNHKEGSRREMGDDSMNPNSLVVDVQNFAELLSASVESLDDTTPELPDFDEEPELVLTEHEPEAWSVTVDKKTLKKMSAKNIKRQDHIWELIQTEKNHYRTLKIMQKIFAHGMLHELSLTQDMVDRIFPRLDDLLEIHFTFVLTLISVQKLSADKSVEEIGEILLQQFDGKMADRVKDAYGEFCSRHIEAVQFYKDLLKSDPAFQAFIKKCNRNNLCKRLGIPECILLVTQRMTKYPLLIEPILKTTSENTREKKSLEQCLSLARDILGYIDRQVDARVKEQRLFDIYNKLDARSCAILNGKKFKKSDLLSNKRKLLFEGSIKWMSARGKPAEVNAVVLSDVLFFLTENSQKSQFCSQDNKSSVIPLSKLLVREKGDTRDSKGLYLICQSRTEPEMYEFVCKSAEDRKLWIKTIRDAIINCPEEGEPSESEEERKLQEAIGARLRQLIDQLHQRDHIISMQCQEKFNIALEILEIFAKDDMSNMVKAIDSELDKSKAAAPETILQSILHEVSKLFALMQPATRTVSVMRSFSSAGEHRPNASMTVVLPKRAGTFSGFEGRSRSKVHQKVNRETGNISEDDDNTDTDVVEATDGALAKDENPQQLENDGESEQRLDVTISESANYLTVDSSNTLETLGQIIQPQTELSFTREQCFCIAKILQHVNEIVCISAHQMTEVESVRGHLSEANNKLLRLNSENERLSHERKSPNYHPDKQLEELRILQESIQMQRSSLDKVKEEQKTLVNIQKDELKQMQQDIDRQKAELKAQKEELQRQKEALQRQIDLFEEQRSHQMKVLMGAGTVSGAQPTPQKTSSAIVVEGARTQTSHDGASGGNHRSLMDSVSHHRSASDDLLQAYAWMGDRSDSRISGAEGGGSLRFSTGSARTDDARPVTRMQSMSAVSSGNLVTGGFARRERDKAVLPVQLLSTTNEQKGGQVPQQLPLKLASPGSGEPGNHDGMAGSLASKSNRLSMKTAPPLSQPRLLAMPAQVHSPPGIVSRPSAPAEVAAPSQRVSSVTVGRVLPQGSSSSPQNAFFHPASVIRTDGLMPIRAPGPATHSSFIQSPVAQNSGEHFKPRLVSTQSASNILPMKLAERPRPKSASTSAQQSPISQKRSSGAIRTPPGCEDLVHSMTSSKNNSDKRIIYF